MKLNWIFCIILFGILLVLPVSATSIVSISDGKVETLNNITTLELVLDQTSNGLSGYNITISIANQSIASFTGFNFPTWASPTDSSGFPASSAWVKAVDLQQIMDGSMTNVSLGSISIKGIQTGTTEVTLIVNALDDINGTAIATTTQPGTFTVHGPTVIAPTANFTGNMSSGDSPLTVQFTDNSSGTAPLTYLWDFGDGSPNETSANPVHTFSASTTTTYTVTMTVNNTAGSSSQSMAITVNATPVTTPPDSIADLHNITYQDTRITWNWSDPSSETFDHVMISLDGVFKANVTKGVQTFTVSGLNPSTMYTLETRTVGTTGLTNETWVNHTATTAPHQNVSSFTVALNSGWNLFSTPIVLEQGHSQFSQVFPLEEQEKMVMALGWDGSLWYTPQATDDVTPLYAFYIIVKDGETANATILPATVPSSPPVRSLTSGWNLIGPAPAYQDGGFAPKPVEDSLITIDGNYSIVLSPGLNQQGWSYVQGDPSTDLLPYKGYWVYMNNPDTLAGFSTTPL